MSADWRSWRPVSIRRTGSAPSSRTRTGWVLMNRPTIDSTSGSSGGRPETVPPNTTSVRPARRASTIAQAPCTTVLTVRPCCRANCVRARVPSSESSAAPVSGSAGARPWSERATRVDSSAPASSACQAARAASLSCASSQAR